MERQRDREIYKSSLVSTLESQLNRKLKFIENCQLECYLDKKLGPVGPSARRILD